ncbi:MAG: DegT/DnrJ/EryC1/StrS family aminotransferase, partial [Selenomonadaceae bacterium]|nr:DegT/DnrJ/EryC1/StrS family aminotransferase [Selenomonadaceae bacterium]
EDGGIEKARRICAALKEDGIEARSFWKPVHLQKPYRESIQADSLEVAEGLWDRIVTLPCSTWITDGELETVSQQIKSIMMSSADNGKASP